VRVKITFRENGSIGIETNGFYTIRIGETERVIEKAKLSLCRCGHTKNAPFCDGTHKEIGFIAPAGELEWDALNGAIELPANGSDLPR
jgi:CDGSH iron-sulfur domain-containing protein 3